VASDDILAILLIKSRHELNHNVARAEKPSRCHDDGRAGRLQIRLDGLFKDTAAEETFRAQAFARSLRNYELIFPNSDKYTAAFAVENYTRGGAYDGIETFSATLRRSGDGVYTQAP
jgi:predicted secreted protein